MIELEITQGDLAQTSADVLILHRRRGGFEGADWRVASTLRRNGLLGAGPTFPPDTCTIIWEQSYIPVAHILILESGEMEQDDYENIRAYAQYIFATLRKKLPNTQSVVLRLPEPEGVSDEMQFYYVFFDGLLESLQRKEAHRALKKITVVSDTGRRVERSRELFESEFLPKLRASKRNSGYLIAPEDLFWEDKPITQGRSRDTQPYIFVAMPFAAEYEDIYHYGISGAARKAGFICERVDEDAFLGDILTRVKEKIEKARLVVALLDSANPNVYLELGFAWGRNRPTLLITANTEELRFDVQGQRCLIYNHIRELEEKLTKELTILLKKGEI